MNDPNWDYPSIIGHNSMPIFHDTFINICKDYSNKNIYDNIYVFAFRSVAFNTITPWMKQGLDTKNFNHRMHHGIFLSAFNNAENWHINKDLLKIEPIIDIQNKFYLMWLDWYVQNIKNVKFVFWCHFGSEYVKQKTYPPHLCYADLYSRYKDNCVDLNRFAEKYEMDKVFKDGDFHPTDYGYESIRQFLNEESLRR
jgi:hypothetical protein